MANISSAVDPETAPDAELPHRPDKKFLAKSQAEFLAIASSLRIPILGRKSNHVVASGVAPAGVGGSFDVSRPKVSQRLNLGSDFANAFSPTWFDYDQENPQVTVQNPVTKRIQVTGNRPEDEPGILAALTNEVRILALEGVHKSANIVSLFAVSWYQVPIHDRFWPQLLLEGAPLGSLADFQTPEKPSLGFALKSFMMLQIMAGLGALHSHGVVHCDMKPRNILVFDHAEHCVTLKLCDFGFSVILSDYDRSHPFLAHIGTWPHWVSPEMDSGEPIRLELLHKVDIYSLGLICAAVFTNGRQPFLGSSSQEIRRFRLLDPSEEMSSKTFLMLQVRRLGGFPESHWMAKIILGSAESFLQHSLHPDPTNRMTLDQLYRIMQAIHCGMVCLESEMRLDNENFAPSVGIEAMDYIRTSRLPSPQGLDMHNARYPPIQDRPFVHAGEFGSSGFLANIPDISCESSVRFAMLPREAVSEIRESLKRCVKGHATGSTSNEAGQVLLQYSAGNFNGVIGNDPEAAWNDFNSAIVAEDHVSLCIARNIAMATGHNLPSRSKEIVDSMLQDTGMTLTATSIKLFFPLRPEHKLKPALIRSYTWARDFPDAFAEYLQSNSRRQHCGTISRKYAAYFRQDFPGEYTRPVVQPVLLTGYSISASEADGFVNEVTRLGCLDQPGEGALTLLQTAVVNGNLSMIRLLLERLNADVNAYGNTAGWTPLWLASMLGYGDIALRLLSCHGADASCRDQIQGISILHMLSQFTGKETMTAIGEHVLEAGVDVNSPTKAGVTPLMATLSLFDYSQGAAFEFLLARGGDPALEFVGLVDRLAEEHTAVSLCATSLSSAQLRRCLDTLHAASNKAGSIKVQAFYAVADQTQFHTMARFGSGWEGELDRVLDLLIDEEMLAALRPPLNDGERIHMPSPVNRPAVLGRPHILESLRRISARNVYAFPQDGAAYALDAAIESGCLRSVQALLQDPDCLVALNGPTGKNYLHRAAELSPGLLLPLIELLPTPQSNVKDILELEDDFGFKVFDFLLADGYAPEREIAETLRVRYSLEYDAEVDIAGVVITPAARLILTFVTQGIVDPGNIRYLLNLDPKPKFQLSSGVTLLSLAMEGFVDVKSKLRRDLIRLLLTKYPEFGNLTAGRGKHLPAIHRAAREGNVEALEVMREHVELHHQAESFPWNYVHEGGTVIDAGFSMVRETNQHDNFGDPYEPLELDISQNKDRVAECYQYLRQQGAMHSFELKGYIVNMKWTSDALVSEEDLQTFLARATGRFSLASWKYDQGPIPFGVENAHRLGHDEPTRIVGMRGFELVWDYDCFRLQGFEAHLNARRYAEERREYIDERIMKNLAWRPTCGPGNYPFTMSRYQFNIAAIDRTVEYTRPGRVWSFDEVEEMVSALVEFWDVSYGDRERLAQRIAFTRAI